MTDRDPGAKTRMNGLHNARIVDIALFRKMVADVPGIGAKRLARALGVDPRLAQSLMRGEHWQQDPVKIRLFNEYKHATVDEETGVACAADMKEFGLSRAQKRAAAAALRPGTPSQPNGTDPDTEAVEALAGDDLPPMKLDTAFFQGEVDTVIWRLLRQMTTVKIQKMSGREIAAAANGFIEKRALLRGEPTAIVRSENRGSLEKVGELLLAEMARRAGMKVREPEMITVEAGK
jgi:hypothetical protein